MRHIIDAIAAQGRDGDTELLHVTKGELAGLDGLARKVYGRSLPRNPRTGIKEASLFRDWFGNDVGMAMDVAVPTLAGAALTATGAGAPAGAALLGAGLGAANQGLGEGGSWETAALGGATGAMGGYGGAGLAEGLAGAGAAAAPTTAAPTAAVTPLSEAGSGLAGGVDIAGGGVQATQGTGITSLNEAAKQGMEMYANTGTTALDTGGQMASGATGAGGSPAASSNIEGAIQLKPGQSITDALAPGGVNNPVEMGQPAYGGAAPQPTAPQYATKTDYLMSKDALAPATKIGTSAMMTAGIPGAATDTTPTVPGVNKTLPKAEVYYTPYGERRTRIAAAQGGLMGYGDYDGAEDGVGLRSYGFGGFVESIQPGGWWGDQTSELYGAVDKALPFMKDITPGGAVGQLQPGRRDWERKQTEEEQRKKSEQEAGIAAALKAQQQQEFTDKWTDRYSAPVNMAEGGYTGPRDGEAVSAIVRASQPKEENAFEHPAIRKIAGQNVTQADFDAWNSARQGPNAFEHPMIRRMAGQNVTQDDLTTWNNRQRGYAGGGITNIAAAKGRYLQGPGGGLDDEIPARIDGKQEARLASGEYVVSSDVVSALGGGSSEEGARQLHAMMDRVRKQAHGTKKQINRVNPKKALPA